MKSSPKKNLSIFDATNEFIRLNAEQGYKSIYSSVYRAITQAKDNTGRQLASIFFVKPDPDRYPDYYEVIQEPIDLKTIDHKITKNHYKSIDDMMKDVFLMFKNAKAGFQTDYQIIARIIASRIIAKLKS